MRRANNNHTQIHSEIKHLKQLRMRESQNNDAKYFGQCDATKYLLFKRKKHSNKYELRIRIN